jgi:hypothetical protein
MFDVILWQNFLWDLKIIIYLSGFTLLSIGVIYCFLFWIYKTNADDINLYFNSFNEDIFEQ